MVDSLRQAFPNKYEIINPNVQTKEWIVKMFCCQQRMADPADSPSLFAAENERLFEKFK